MARGHSLGERLPRSRERSHNLVSQPSGALDDVVDPASGGHTPRKKKRRTWNPSPSADTSGVAFAAEFRSARKINDRWIATLDASILSSDAHEDARIGVSLRFTPDGRASVLNRDLAPDPFNRDIW